MVKLGDMILAVEDDENDILLFRRTLKKLSIDNSVQFVGNGDEAIKYLSGEEKYSDRSTYPFPSLVLTDLKMPRVTGFEVLEWMKNNPAVCATVPALVWSSSPRSEDVERAYQLGASHYFQKPCNLDEWAEKLGAFFTYLKHCKTVGRKFGANFGLTV